MKVRLAAVLASALFVSSPALAAAAWPDVGTPATTQRDGDRDAAVVIGVEHYFAVPGVPGAARNATDWYRFLVDGRGLPVERVHLLRDAQAAREGILEKIEQASKQVEAGGTLWVVFIGHGAPAKDGSEGMFVGVDAQQTATSLDARSVKQSEVAAAAAHGKQGEILAVVDACFSGRGSKGDAIASGLQPLVAVRAPSLTRMTMLSAGSANEFAGALPNEDRPAFSYLVLGALRGWGDANHDGVVSAKEAVDYARKTLAVLPIGRTQTPEVVGANAGFVLARNVAEEPPNVGNILAWNASPASSYATPAPEAPRSPGFGWKLAGYSTLSLTAVAGALAVYKHTVAIDKQEEADQDCGAAPGCADRRRAANDEAEGGRTGRRGFIIIGSVLGVTSAFLLWKGYSAEGSVSAQVLVGPDSIGIAGSF